VCRQSVVSTASAADAGRHGDDDDDDNYDDAAEHLWYFSFFLNLVVSKTYYWVMVGRIARRGGSGKCWRLKKYFV